MQNNYLFVANRLPVHQNIVFDDIENAINCSRGDITLIQDQKSGMVHNSSFDPNIMSYGKNYQNEQAYSLFFQNHLKNVLSIINSHFQNKKIIEIGCGKGKFLDILLENGFDAIGIDPSYEGDNQHVIKEYFSPKLNITADALILRHTLEHIKDPYSFLSNIYDSNNGAGLIYIEVPCLDWIQTHKAWFDIFYEHVNYFRLENFDNIFSNIIQRGRLFNEQYIYVIADISSLKKNEKTNYKKIIFPKDFMNGIDTAISKFNVYKNKKNAVWGGSSKGVIFCHYLMQKGCVPDMIIDINPVKQGKYAPSSGIKICSPHLASLNLSKGSNIFIMNSNYLEEIVEETKNQYNYILIDK